MQKITEIPEKFTTKQKSRVNGVVIETTQNRSRFRRVDFVEGGARFGHYLLDRLCLMFFSVIFGVFLGILLALTGHTSFLDDKNINFYETIFNWVILQPCFYFIFEFSMQATPGKAILKRVVIDEYGNKPTAKQLFIRSVARAVPFEPFSCFNTLGWHDSWSKTYVIRKKDLEELKLFQKINQLDSPISEIPEA
ncbi:MAG TPA: RDD family protein [Bacteroidia bacterium]|nr:RDD family protein [Bacteroidia bacterium]